MYKHVFAGLFLSLSMLAAGCVAGPGAPDVTDDVEGEEDVAEAEQAIIDCPEQTICYDACFSQELIWGGRCTDDGACICKPELGGLGHPGGGGRICSIDWSDGSWSCGTAAY